MILRSIIIDQPNKELILYTDEDSNKKHVDEWFVLEIYDEKTIIDRGTTEYFPNYIIETFEILYKQYKEDQKKEKRIKHNIFKINKIEI